MVELQFMEPHNPTSNKNNHFNIIIFYHLLHSCCVPGLLNALSHLSHATTVLESYHFNSTVKATEVSLN